MGKLKARGSKSSTSEIFVCYFTFNVLVRSWTTDIFRISFFSLWLWILVLSATGEERRGQPGVCVPLRALFLVFIPPAKRSFRGVYCFEPVRHSVIPSFRDLFFLWFCSVTLVPTARFCSNFHRTLAIRHCMFCRKIGAEGSVLQELCHFVILTARYFCAHFFMIFLCIFCSYCPILFKFSPHLNHHTLHVLLEKKRGWRVSIARDMPLCNFNARCLP